MYKKKKQKRKWGVGNQRLRSDLSDDDDEGRKKRTQSSLYVSHHTHTQIKHTSSSWHLNRPKCASSRRAALANTRYFFFLLRRLFLASISFVCCDYSFFFLSLSLPSLDRVALPLSSSTSGEGREEVERVARCCFRAPSSFVVVVYLCRPKSWARRDARRSWKRLD